MKVDLTILVVKLSDKQVKLTVPSYEPSTMDTATVLITLASVLLMIYAYLRRKYSYWSSRDIRGPKPVLVLGNFWQIMTMAPDVKEREWAQEYGPMYGEYIGVKPTLTLTDPELIKQIMVKDFAWFINRRELNTYHEVANKMLTELEDDEWKRVRSLVTPTFTSGKLKGMSPLMMKCIGKLNDYLGNLIDQSNSAKAELDTKTVLSGFTIDVIASTTFATDVHSNGVDRNSRVVKACQGLFRLNPIKAMLGMTLPVKLNTLLGVDSFFPDNEFRYLLNLIENVVQTRSDQQAVKSSANKRPNDLIQLLLNAQQEPEQDWRSMDYNKLTLNEDIASTLVNTNGECLQLSTFISIFFCLSRKIKSSNYQQCFIILNEI